MIPAFVSPILNKNGQAYINSGWGEDRSYRGAGKIHNGLDFPASIGTPVMAAASGTVVAAGDVTPNPAGKMIVIQHAGGWFSRYLHLNKIQISSDQSVSAGQQIGESGNSGIKESAAHLHFDIRATQAAVNEYVGRFGKPTNTQFPGDYVSGGYGVPGEPLIPATYDQRVKDRAAKLGIKLYVGMGITTLLIVGGLIYYLVG